MAWLPMLQSPLTALPSLLRRVARPARYTGGEWGTVLKAWDEAAVRVCIVYPDTYENGVLRPSVNSLYAVLNGWPDVVAERVFAPWPDYTAALRSIGASLTSLESGRPLTDFDVLMVCYPHELSAPTVLELLDLGGLPIDAVERSTAHPLVVGWEEEPRNPEPLAPFLDAYLVGDVEAAVQGVVRALTDRPIAAGAMPDRYELVASLVGLPGLYLPSQYGLRADGSLRPSSGSRAPAVVRRVAWQDLSSAPVGSVVPHLQAAPDRPSIEADRGSPPGCDGIRLGLHWGPFRSRSAEATAQAASRIVRGTGFQEVALSSTCLHQRADRIELVQAVRDASRSANAQLRLPTLAPVAASADVLRELRHTKQNVAIGPIVFGTEVEGNWMDAMDEALADCAARGGLGNVRIAGVLGHPEAAAPALLERDGTAVSRWMRSLPANLRQLRVEAAFFVPRAFTLLERRGQADTEEMSRQLAELRVSLGRRVSVSPNRETGAARVEAAIARGGRETAEAVRHAWKGGCYLSGSTEGADADAWQAAFAAAGLSIDVQAGRTFGDEEVLPWGHLAGWQDSVLIEEVRLGD